MVDSKRFDDFLSDKRMSYTIFSVNKDLTTASQKATQKDFKFLAENRFLLEQEFNHLYASLLRNGKDKEEFWLYCYYCCELLKTYYAKEGYDHPQLAADYAQYALDIQRRLNKSKKVAKERKEDETFLRTLLRKIAKDLTYLVTEAPKHTSSLKKGIGMMNLYRLVILFSRISVKQSLLMAQEFKWLDKLSELFGKPIDLESMVANINAPTDLFNALSVGLFLSRFILNVGISLKHILMPKEKEKIVSTTKRAVNEGKRRHYHFGNDAAWASVNGLANYANLFNISVDVANWLTAGFLVFDLTLLAVDHVIALRDYKLKKAQYELELKDYKLFIDKNHDIINNQARKDRVEEQLKELTIEWKSNNAFYQFNIAAALILLVGFTVPLIFTASVAATVSYLFCTLSIAMYMSGDNYRAQVNTSLIAKQYAGDAHVSQEDKQAALAKANEARQTFVFGMIKNSTVPILMVAVFAVCWEAALLLTVLYAGYGYVSRARKDYLAQRDANKALESSDESSESSTTPSMT